MDVATGVLLDVQRTTAGDPRALLRFVTRWGLLGIGIPGASDFGADDVTSTGEWLVRLRQWIEDLHALRRGITSDTTWAKFAATLNEQLVGIHPVMITATAGGLERGFRAKRLLDALLFELWDQATEGQRVRRAPLFETFAMDWVEERRSAWKASTRQQYEQVLKSQLRPAFTDLRLSAITESRVMQLLTGLQDGGLSARRLNLVLLVLKMIL